MPTGQIIDIPFLKNLAIRDIVPIAYSTKFDFDKVENFVPAYLHRFTRHQWQLLDELDYVLSTHYWDEQDDCILNLFGTYMQHPEEKFVEYFGGAPVAALEQGRKTLHSHVLLFIALFDRLISLLWSDSEDVRKLAKEELIRYMSKAMSSSYELVEEDFLHEKKGEKLDCSISTCQIVPSVVHNQVLRNMRHQRYCHILKGFVGKCDGCGGGSGEVMMAAGVKSDESVTILCFLYTQTTCYFHS